MFETRSAAYRGYERFPKGFMIRKLPSSAGLPSLCELASQSLAFAPPQPKPSASRNLYGVNEKENSARRFSAHDFLFLGDEEAFVSSIAPEPWVDEVLRKTRTVVVRRGPRPGVLIPVGVRGKTIAQRCAGFISPASVLEKIKPEQIVEKRAWLSSPRRDEVTALRHLETVAHAWLPYNVLWGPVGTIGFELVTGLPVSEMNSNLDLLIRTEQRIPLDLAQRLMETSKSTAIEVDVHLETPQGGIALEEYLRQSPKLLVYTDAGPKLVPDPWSSQET